MLARPRVGAALLAGPARAANTFKIILILPTTSGQTPIGRPIDIITLCRKQGGDTSLDWPRRAGPRQFSFRTC